MPKNTKSEFSRFLMVLANKVGAMSEDEFSAFMAGNVLGRTVSQPKTRSKGPYTYDKARMTMIIEALSALTDRTAGYELLDKEDLTKRELVDLAKIRDIHILKTDNVGKVREKIVEVIIGSQLASKAIQGKPPRY